MAKKILLLIFFSFFLYAKKSDPFFLTIKKPFDSALFSVVEDYDGTVSAVGFSNEYKQTKQQTLYHSAFDYLANSSENLYGKKPILVTVDSAADIVIEKFAKIKDFSEAIGVVKSPQNGYYVGGYTFNGKLLLAKLDSNGNTIFVRKFGTKNYDRMNSLIALSDGGVLAIGNSTTSRDTHDPMFQTGLGLNDIFITRFNSNGKILWSKKYGTKFDDMGIDAVEAYDGSIIVLAATTYDKHKDITLMRIGENGDKIWLKHFQSEILQTPKKLLRLRDNNFIAVIDQQDEMQKDQIRLVKFDLQKNVLVDSTLATYYTSILEDIKEYANSTLIGVGLIKDRFNTDAFVVILDENLEMLCQEHFGNDSYDIFHGVAILRDSTAMAVGLTTPKGKQITNMLFAKIKPDCTLAPKEKVIKQKKSFYFQTKSQMDQKNTIDLSAFNTDSIKSTTLAKDFTSTNIKQQHQFQKKLYKKLLDIFQSQIEAKKISIEPSLVITLDTKELLFKQGQYQLNEKQKKFLDRFIPKFIAFLQRYKEQIKAIEISGHTSSEWKKNDNFTQRFLNNQELSLKRAYSVSSYIFKHLSIQQQKLFAGLLKDSGWSFAKAKYYHNRELKEQSRRVSFSIILK